MSTNSVPPKKSKHRSPNYPSLGLSNAIKRTEQLHGKYGTHELPVALAQKLWGLKEFTAQGDRMIAALKSYGLIHVTSKGKDRKIALTSAAERIVRRAPDRDELVKKAALGPAVHREIVEHYDGKGLPDDELLQAYLVWERPEGQRFNQESVDKFIKRFRATLAFARLAEDDKIHDGSNDDADDDPDDDTDTDSESPADRNKQRPPRKERKRMEGTKEDVFSLDDGALIVQWPERIYGASAEDINDWLELIGKKIKRAVESSSDDDDPDEDE